jgi:hypothetical protein
VDHHHPSTDQREYRGPPAAPQNWPGDPENASGPFKNAIATWVSSTKTFIGGVPSDDGLFGQTQH